ncbi:MAG: hypothetical protein KDC91_10250, partial [Flavobacteriaceae bacterium]|nr:hypothetical protein [Flavobacteriaceae bacterium]
MKNKEDIGKLLAERLKGLRPTPPINTWEALEDALHKKEKKKRRKFFLLWMTTGVSLALLILFVSKTTKSNNLEVKGSLIENRDNSTTKFQENTSYSTTEEVFKTFKMDTINYTQEDESDTLYPKKLSTNNAERKKLNKIKKQLKDHTFWTEESETKTTKYYYYNDATKKT